MESLAYFLKKERISRKYDMRGLAQKSGVASAQISRIETGKSDVTLEALVRLAYGLGFRLDDVMAILFNTYEKPSAGPQVLTTDVAATHKSCLGYLQNRFSKIYRDLPIPSVGDIYSAIMLFREHPIEVENILTEGFLENFDKPNPPLIDKQSVVGKINKSIYIHADYFSSLPFPKTNDLENVYAAGGVITLADLAISVKNARRDSGKSLEDVVEEANHKISRSTLARFEQIDFERIFISYILELDRIFYKGALIASAWEAEEYETGIVISRLSEEREQEWVEGKGWNLVEKAVADTFITICRWHHAQEGDQSWWIKTKHILDSYTA